MDPADLQWPVRTSLGTNISLSLLARIAGNSGIRHVADLPDGTQLNLGRHQRLPTPALRRALLARDIHCQFPGCSARHHLHAHHIHWWIHGGPTNADNLLMMCPKHHHAIHDRHWTLTGTATHPVFTRPDGRPVDRTPPPMSGSLAELITANDTHGTDIAVEHPGGHWYGDHIDWDCFYAAFAVPQRPHHIPDLH